MFQRMKSRKSIFLVLALVVMIGVIGCSGAQNDQKPGAEQTGESKEGLSGTIQIAGSTSVQPISEELAVKFMELNPDMKIDVAGGGSSAGVKAATEGTADIGTSSRELRDEEKGLGLTETVIAKDGIAVIVNAANGVDDLTLGQVKKIYNGELNNWKYVGGKDAPITVINREEGSGTRGAFEEIVLGKDGKFTDKAAIQNSTGAVRTSVAQDENAIGYISMGSMSQELKAVKVDGVEATSENVLNGTFKISRPFLYLTKDANELTKVFIDWIISAEGQDIVGEEFIPVN